MSKKQIRKTFRSEVFKRDGYKCRCCGKNGYDRQESPENGKVPLDSHHILNRTEIANGGYVKQNGISLCEDCHLKAEKYHITLGEEWEPGFHPDDLYAKIGSSLKLAIYHSSKL